MALHWRKKKSAIHQSKNAAYVFFFQMNVLNANKNYDAFAGKKHRVAINRGANAYYSKKLQSNGNKKFDTVKIDCTDTLGFCFLLDECALI